MIRAWIAILIIVCPSVLAQEQTTIRCADGFCVVPIEVIKILLARAEMNCGPIR